MDGIFAKLNCAFGTKTASSSECDYEGIIVWANLLLSLCLPIAL